MTGSPISKFIIDDKSLRKAVIRFSSPFIRWSGVFENKSYEYIEEMAI